MTAGFQVFNDSGELQIDQDYLNFEFTQKGTVTCDTSFTTGGVTKYYTRVLVYGDYPLVAIRNETSNPVYMYRMGASGSAWEFLFMSSTNGTTIEYFVFEESPRNSNPINYGLQIFRANGEQAFHSGNKPLKIVDAVTYSFGDGDSNSNSYPSGKTYAVIHTAPGKGELWIPDPTMNFSNPPYQHSYRAWYPASRWSGRHMYTYAEIFEQYTSETLGTADNAPPTTFLVIDVTDY